MLKESGWLPTVADSTGRAHPPHAHAARVHCNTLASPRHIHPHLTCDTPLLFIVLVDVSFRAARNAKRTKAAAAIAIQRWRRQLVHARTESARAHRELATRRWAVDKLHAAYARRWRFQVAALRERRRKFEEEEAVRLCSSFSEVSELGCMQVQHVFVVVGAGKKTRTEYDLQNLSGSTTAVSCVRI